MAIFCHHLYLANWVFTSGSSWGKSNLSRCSAASVQRYFKNTQLAKYKWWQKIAMFIKAKRYISQMDTLQSVIHADTSKAPKQLNYHTYTLSPIRKPE
jgi:hypothetical protein